MYRRCTHKATNMKQVSFNVTAITHEKVNLDHVYDAHDAEIRAMLARNSSM